MQKIILLACIIAPCFAHSQSVSINNDGSLADNSAMLHIASTSKGLLIPRMTEAQRNAISNPATGLMVFQTDAATGYYYNAGSPASPSWTALGAAQWLNNGSKIYYNANHVGIGASDPAGPLHVRGVEWNAAPVIFENTNENSVGPTLRFNTPLHSYDIIGATGSGAATGAGYFSIYDNTNNAYRLVVSPAGNIGIGINTPATDARLHVENDGNYAGYFRNSYTGTTDRFGLYAISNNSPGHGYGIRSVGGYIGAFVEGHAPNYNGAIYGVYATATGGGNLGSHYGIYATSLGGATNYAGYFAGTVHVAGTLSKSAGTFRIDHPLDPANKTLSHSFVESPDMLNVYTGNVQTDADGTGIALLPSYFEALNITYTYQLTVIGQFAQAIVFEEITGNRFIIKTDRPHVKVSWMVTGVRNDPYARQYRVMPEEEKKGNEKGLYLNPDVYNQPEAKAIGRRPAKENR